MIKTPLLTSSAGLDSTLIIAGSLNSPALVQTEHIMFDVHELHIIFDVGTGAVLLMLECMSPGTVLDVKATTE